jgi:phosphate-selective porin OprO/OprP
MLFLVFSAACAWGNEPGAPTQDSNQRSGFVRGLFHETPYINSLLVKREFPIIGGAWYAEVYIDAPLNGEPDGAQLTLRNAKLGYLRNLGKNWRFKATGNYTKGGGLELDDTYFNYNGWDRVLLTMGINKPPFSLEFISSSAALTFMERGLPVEALAERRSGGISVLHRSPDHIVNAELILINLDQDNLREKGRGMVLHYVHSPLSINLAKNFYVGTSLSYRKLSSSDSSQFRSRPEIATMNDYFVDTGDIENVDSVTRLSFEASRVSGRFSLQSEILAAEVNRRSMTSLNFWGAYAYASYFLTEDSRNYDSGVGDFEPVSVHSPFLKGGYGAFELGFRASTVNLTDKEIIGGRETNVTFGLNWYLNNQIRVMTNLIKVLDVNRPGSEYNGQAPWILSMRFQWVMK